MKPASSIFTPEQLDDILVTAFEGGSNYWALLGESNPPDNFVRKANIHYEVLDRVYQGGSLEFFDAEDEEEKLGVLTLENIERGIQVMTIYHRRILGSLVSEDYDASDADVFLQCCVMGEVVYG